MQRMHLPAELLFVTVHFPQFVSRTFERGKLTWTAFSMEKEIDEHLWFTGDFIAMSTQDVLWLLRVHHWA